MINIYNFINEWKGQEVTDPWGGYKGECVSLVKRWISENGWSMLRGNAINWQYNGVYPYRWIKNYWWTVPQGGDIAVFEVGTYGHIGIVLPGASVFSMQVFNQNWPTGNDTDPARITSFNYKSPKCLGYIRHIG